MSHKTRSHKKPSSKVRRAKSTAPPLPAVRCGYDQLVDPTTLTLGANNDWHKHPKDQLDLYAKIIADTGWRRAIVVSRRSGQVVKGNGATLTALAQGWAKVPVEFQDYDTDAQELADMVADNKLAQLAGTDETKLRALLLTLGIPWKEKTYPKKDYYHLYPELIPKTDRIPMKPGGFTGLYIMHWESPSGRRCHQGPYPEHKCEREMLALIQVTGAAVKPWIEPAFAG